MGFWTGAFLGYIAATSTNTTTPTYGGGGPFIEVYRGLDCKMKALIPINSITSIEEHIMFKNERYVRFLPQDYYLCISMEELKKQMENAIKHEFKNGK